jgi:hypothetical protein
MKVDLAICRKTKDEMTICRVSSAAFCRIMKPRRDNRQQSAGFTGGTGIDYVIARGEIGPKSVHPFIVPSIHRPGMELVLGGAMTRTGMSGWWRVAGKEPSGELNRKSRIAKGRSKVANFKSKSGKRNRK